MPNPPSTVNPGVRQRRKEARPQELLDAALELFVEKGYAATRTDEVAARAGVSKGTLYLYFPSKEDLFKAVVRQRLTSLIAEGMEIARAFEGPTAELLALLLHTWWERVGQTPAASIVKIVVCEVGNFPELALFYAQEVIEPTHQLLGGMLERGIARKEFRPVPVDHMVHLLVAPMLFECITAKSMVTASMSCHQELNPQDLIKTQVDSMLRGLLMSPESVDAIDTSAAFQNVHKK